MKKHIIILAAIFTAALVAPACYPDDAPGLKNDGLTISLFSDDPETKAYNPTMETAIDHFDFFFFKDEAGTEPIAGMHGHATGSSVTLQTGKNQTYAALRKGTSYVYIVANYPGTISHSVDWILEDLLNLVVEYPIATGKATQINPISGDEEETGDVNFNPNLVMDSYHKETNATAFTYTYKINPPTTINENRTVNVAMSRLAAKLILKVNVATSVPGTMPTPADKPEVWTPVLNELKAYYVNALNNKTTVRATPVQRSAIPASQADLYKYFTYPTPYPIVASTDDPYKFTAAPAFTYPQTWTPGENGDPYFKIQMIWKSNYRGTSNFYYKVRVPRAANDGFCTLNRNTCYTVTVDLAVVDPENEYVELDGNYKVVKWAESGWVGGDNLSAARFFNVPKTEYELYSRESIEIPYYSSSAVSAYFEEISFTYYGTPTRPEYTFTYGNESDVSVTLPTTYNGSSIPSAARDRNTYTVEVVGKNVVVTHALTNVFTKRTIKVTIKNQDGDDETVTIVQHPSIEVVTIPTRTIFVNGHFARATENVHVNNPSNPQKIGVKWGPMKYLSDAGQYRYHSDDSDISEYWTWGSWQNSNYNGGESTTARIKPRPEKGIYGTVEGDWTFLAEPFMTIIAVSAFNENNCTYTYIQNSTTQGPKKYRIGDPRVEGNLSLANYLYKPSTVRNADETTSTGAAEYRAWEEPLKVLIASQNANDGNIIAPRFLLSSSLNCMTDGGNSFVNAQKRAATYQEAGYPAGRWRLPTEAEIAFMIARQNEGIIPSVWGTTDYWCADGRVVHRGSNTNTYFSAHSGNAYNRFVYDLWYWGDDPMEDTETYYPNMHRVTPNN